MRFILLRRKSSTLRNYTFKAAFSLQTTFSRAMSSTTNADEASVDLIENFKSIQAKIEAATQALKENSSKKPQKVQLIAVSKTKPKSLIKELYDFGHRDFGENYVQELEDKASSLKEECPDIRWHFIGHLQSNKIKLITSIDNLHMIQTVDSEKLARKLNTAVEEMRGRLQDASFNLNIMIQVNTSGEESKGGVEPSETSALVEKILTEYTNLRLMGLMSIGRRNAPKDQPDFTCLQDCREAALKSLQDKDLKLDNDLELSMGMSADFEEAIEFGSNYIRVGSSIFGTRNYNK